MVVAVVVEGRLLSSPDGLIILILVVTNHCLLLLCQGIVTGSKGVVGHSIKCLGSFRQAR